MMTLTNFTCLSTEHSPLGCLHDKLPRLQLQIEQQNLLDETAF